MDSSNLYYHYQLLQRKLEVIKQLRVKSIISPCELKVSATYKTEEIDTTPPCNLSVINLPYSYGGIDSYLWTVANFEDLDPQKEYHGSFDFGYSSKGLTVGTETLLYINGVEKCGIDVNHQEVNIGKLPQKATFNFRTWTGIADETRLEEMGEIQGERLIEQIHTMKKIQLFELDQVANNLYFNLRALLEGYETLKDTDYINSNLIINDVSEVLLKYDDADIEANLDGIDQTINQILDGYIKPSPVKMIAVGQTHIDVAWLWRIKHTREKIARSFSTMLNLIDNNPQFTFIQSQPVLLEFLKSDYPNIFKRIQLAVAKGQLEIDGAMYLEADCNIPSGESLIRQVLYGKQFIQEEFNHDSKLLWMPDVFGYSSALPQILKSANIDTFCTTKMQWNQVNRMPSNTFLWQGLDGSQVTTHLIEDFDLWKVTGESMHKGWDKYKEKYLTNEIIYQHGYGDGGGGPTQEDIEMVKRLDKVPGLPNIEYGKASTYFKHLNEAVINQQDTVQKWHGEMYLELHRGTFTSQAKMKYFNRKIEYRLRYLEMFIVKTAILFDDVSKEKQQIKTCWKMLLTNQFHDIIPGTSIHDVHVEAVKLYEEILDKLHEIETRLVANYHTDTSTFSIFNGYHRPLSTTFKYKSPHQLEFYYKDIKLESYYYNQEHTVVVNELPPLAFSQITTKEARCLEMSSPISKYDFETKYYKVKFNQIGQITSYFDKQLGKELLIDGNVFNKLVSYEDKPLEWSAWDIDIFYEKNTKVVDDLVAFNVMVENDIETILELKFNHYDSVINQKITLSNITKRIDFTHDVKWSNSQRLLRVLFKTDIIADSARFDTQLGNVLRPTHRNTSWDQQKFEVLGHKWVDISNNSYGVSILTDCKYGYNAKESTIGVSLIKAGVFPDKTQDIGRHQYTYSLYVHEHDVLNSEIDIEAYKLNGGLDIVNAVIDEQPILNIQNQNIYVDALKIAEYDDNVIIRYHEFQNKNSKVTLNVDYQNCNILEEQLECNDEWIGSYELKTNKIKLIDLK